MTTVSPLTTELSPARHRAPAMPAEQRRQLIIAAAWPLMREHGAAVTTSQIAQAAGIAEGTIFRVFRDKRELLLAALHTAMSADAEVDRIAEICSDSSLVERLLAAMAAISDYQDRLWSLMRVSQELDVRPDWEAVQHDHHPRRQMQRIAASVAALLPAMPASLRVEPLSAARILLALAFSRRFEQGIGEPSATAEQLVDLFLHGVLGDHQDSGETD